MKCVVILAIAASRSYGWRCMHARVRLGMTEGTTALMQKCGADLVPLMGNVRKPEGLDEGATVTICVMID